MTLRPVRTLDEIIKDEILYALEFYHWHIVSAAKALGINYTGLYRLLKTPEWKAIAANPKAQMTLPLRRKICRVQNN